MLIEKAEIEVRPGSEEAFGTAMTGIGIPMLASVPGVIGIRFGRGVENPGSSYSWLNGRA